MRLKEKHLLSVQDDSLFEKSMEEILKKVKEDTSGSCWVKSRG